MASPGTSARVPDELLEHTPGVRTTTCPICDGQEFIEAQGSVWCTPHLAIIRPALNTYLRACGRCRGTGWVLDYIAEAQQTPQEASGWETAA